MQNSASKFAILAYFHEGGCKIFTASRAATLKCTQDENLSKDFSTEFREAKFYHCEKFQPLIAGV
ncbi:hypothetical protein [uncultured Campylobacter sp.]|uniref:hypothetical protein n=1 Tax=uncultured Campylobacter sp. TaxID=218934 RepID=UPI00261DF2FA|nr:hypothetical protein [uncultured Campylobacter sp.]